MLRIGFLINFNFLKWLGGIYVIKHLIYSINTFSTQKIEPVLIVKKKLSKQELQEIKEFKLIKTNFFHNQTFIDKLYNKFLVIFFGKSNNYEKFFIKNKINILSHINVFSNNIFFGKKSIIKSLSFIADFQHIHFKENFSFSKRLMRNINTYLCGKYSSKILLCSLNAKKDLKKISKISYKNSVINKFIFKAPLKKEILKLNKLEKKYNFNLPFFYVPNQYWIHKNHFAILKAINYLKKKRRLNKLLILSSGSSEDYRNKNYFNEVKNFISENDLKKNYKHLGIIPFNDVLSLMYHSVAVINPSKFEGRSSTVEQAKSIGKKIILSNIGTHKEQNPERGIYFNPSDFIQLSSILIKTLKKHKKKNEKKFIHKALKKNVLNMKNYCKEYIKIINNL